MEMVERVIQAVISVNMDSKELARKKVAQIFKYLQALDQLRNPVKKNIQEQLWTMWFNELPEHHGIHCPFRELVREGFLENYRVSEEEAYLTIRRPELTVCPTPPAEITDWLEPGWQKIENEPRVIEYKEVLVEEDKETIYFNDDEARISQLGEWVEERSIWKEQELSARKTMKLFERLYTLHASIERDNEQVELILGDGILNWKMTKGQSIYHPVLLQKIRLTFDPNIPEFKLIPSDQPIEFYGSLFRDVQEASALSIVKCTEDLEHAHCLPLDGAVTDAFFRRAVSHLSAKGEFYSIGSDERSKTHEEVPLTIKRNPVVFLRKRSLGFASAIERILNVIETKENIPEAVTRITGIVLEENRGSGEERPITLDINGDNEDILFTKEANSEQLDIALKVNKYGSVLVQGPPGTGKTHTIANLIGHFLSEGKNVLVTSHTSKALQVLRDKVATPLQGLCVSVVDEEGGKGQLDHSIDIITEKLNSLNERAFEEEIFHLGDRRKFLLDRIRGISKDLRMIRENEYTPILWLGEEFAPSEAARIVRNQQEELYLIPGAVVDGVGCPLSVEDIEELYRTNGQVSLADELEFECLDIQPDELVNPEYFTRMVTEYHRLVDAERDAHVSIWMERPDVDKEQITFAYRQAMEAVSIISDDEPWKHDILAAGWDGGTGADDWIELIGEINELTAKYKAAKSVVYKYGPEIPLDANDQELARVVRDIIGFLSSGKKLSFLNRRILNPSWDRAIKNIKVNSVTPSELEHFEAVLTVLDHRIKQKSVFARWERQIHPLGGPDIHSLGTNPEDVLEQLSKEIEHCSKWYQETWASVLAQFKEVGLDWGKLTSSFKAERMKYSELYLLRRIVNHELSPIVMSFRNKLDWDQVQRQFSALGSLIEPYKDSSLRVPKLLREAMEQLDVTSYRKAYDMIQFLWEKNEILLRRNQLLIRLEAAAPDWAQSISHREGCHGGSCPPGDMLVFWKLRQLQSELLRRSSLSIDDLQKELEKARSEFKDITLQLVERKAWLALEKKTTLKQQNALMGWKLLMRKVGKGTGIRAPQLLAEARELMPQCQTAVPVWIMPISRVVESFRPDSNQFDVVIIDEASQADVMALTALFLGKQVVVVGDDQQVSPDAVGQKQDEVQKIIETHLMGIPNAALYDGQTSIYDLAATSFSGKTQLREHFRCVEPIIQFSNALSYKGIILPLRDSSAVKTRPYTVEYRVDGVTTSAKTNPVEARTTASLILACIENKEYKDATFGVISLLGEEQAYEIDKILHKYLSATEYTRRKIRCGNSAQFQGDERDVIFLSMVRSSDGDGPLSLLSDPGERMRKRYNVAASRARNQMWLVHSLNSATDLKDGDLRKKLLDHFKNPTAASELYKQLEPRTESEFEKEVIRRLINEGYKVVPQWKVGSYRIDMVVEGSGKRLAVECDGDRWHPMEKLAEDMARQTILERLGWTFARIRGSEYYRSPDEAMKKVFDKLDSLGIARELHQSKEGNAAAEGEELKVRIISRASAIRQEWEEQQEEYTFAVKKKVDRRSVKAAVITVVEEPKPVVVDIPINPKIVEQQMDLFETEGRFELCAYLKDRNIPFVDRRDKGGALWVIGGWSLNRVMKDLKSEHGIEFLYLESGSNVSKKQPAWYTKWKG